MFYFEDMGIEEIAARLKIPSGTVKRRLFDARKKLKEMLGSMDEARVSEGFEEKVREKVEELSYYLFEEWNKLGCEEEKIKFIDSVAIPAMEKRNSDEFKGYFMFWRGSSFARLGESEKAKADFLRAKELCPEGDVYNALAVSAIETLALLEENAYEGFSLSFVAAESWKYEGGRLMLVSQPGFINSDGCAWMKYSDIGYYISRCGDVFFDSFMKEGESIEGSDGEILTLISKREKISVPAGDFITRHFTLRRTDVDADMWYAEDVGLIKAEIGDEDYRLKEYEIKGGRGLVPFNAGNRWRYVNADVKSYVYYMLEYRMTWTDGKFANLAFIAPADLRRGFEADDGCDSDLYIGLCGKYCDAWRIEDAILALDKAIEKNSTPVARKSAEGGAAYLRRCLEYREKGYRFCPSGYGVSVLKREKGFISYEESDAYGFGPYRFGTRFEENRIFGYKPLRFLQMITGCVWSDEWEDGYEKEFNFMDADVKMRVEKAAEEEFSGCLKITTEAEIPGKKDYYFDDNYAHTFCGKKEWWFKKGVGLIRHDCTWGDMLSSSASLVKCSVIENGGEYFPLYAGNSWEYAESTMTKEGYRAKRIMRVLDEADGKIFLEDVNESVFLGTEAEYEAFKKSVDKN